VQPLSNDMYVTDLALKAATDGAYIEHPLFVYLPPTGMPLPDTIDRFFAVKMDLMASGTGSIGGGTAAFTGFAPVVGAQLKIAFKVVDKFRPDQAGGGNTGGGCKDLNSFKTNVIPVMNVTLAGAGNNCSGCHLGQNANATAAMDITGINKTTDPDILNACNQVRSRINFQNIPQSGVILAPEAGQDAAHPFKLSAANFTTFSNGLTTWANVEK
jgi:hypothetical protein